MSHGFSERTAPSAFGAVHEYPVLADGPVTMVSLDIRFHHDGYDQAVASAKNKRGRNLDLLREARKNDPENPRWIFFMVRDGLTVLGRTQLLELCDALRDLADQNLPTDDRLDARDYYRRALCQASQALAAMGDWFTVHRYCDELDRTEATTSLDAHYFRSVSALLNGAATSDDLMKTIRLRRDDKRVSTSVLDRSGRHLDAVVVAQLAQLKSRSDADRYRDLCAPWTDLFFERSILR